MNLPDELVRETGNYAYNTYVQCDHEKCEVFKKCADNNCGVVACYINLFVPGYIPSNICASYNNTMYCHKHKKICTQCKRWYHNNESFKTCPNCSEQKCCECFEKKRIKYDSSDSDSDSDYNPACIRCQYYVQCKTCGEEKDNRQFLKCSECKKKRCDMCVHFCDSKYCETKTCISCAKYRYILKCNWHGRPEKERKKYRDSDSDYD